MENMEFKCVRETESRNKLSTIFPGLDWIDAKQIQTLQSIQLFVAGNKQNHFFYFEFEFVFRIFFQEFFLQLYNSARNKTILINLVNNGPSSY